MEAVEGPVNWSAVACQAFENDLLAILSRKAGTGKIQDESSE
jgi:hypothetical protein